ncbi:hypothetical protein IQ06DRAFT_349899 [Phaeosphaeriaceae sp. SRC1lsM3a]|nr:hypothetical protein IQ06DRAFT_349899 [Stagonospora sp. SRC1lsM3a]
MPAPKKRKLENTQYAERRSKYALSEMDALKKEVKLLKSQNEAHQRDVNEMRLALQGALGRQEFQETISRLEAVPPEGRDTNKEQAEQTQATVVAGTHEDTWSGRLDHFQEQLEVLRSDMQQLAVDCPKNNEAYPAHEITKICDEFDSKLKESIVKMQADQMSNLERKCSNMTEHVEEQMEVLRVEMHQLIADQKKKNETELAHEITKTRTDYDGKFQNLTVKMLDEQKDIASVVIDAREIEILEKARTAMRTYMYDQGFLTKGAAEGLFAFYDTQRNISNANMAKDWGKDLQVIQDRTDNRYIELEKDNTQLKGQVAELLDLKAKHQLQHQ